MKKKEKYTKHSLPLFDGENYSFWSIQTIFFLQAQGVHVWKFFINK